MKNTILIDGYSSGVSSAVVRHFCRPGYPVELIARNTQCMATGMKELSEDSIQVSVFPTDLDNAGAIKQVVMDVRTTTSPISILHWNAFLDVKGGVLSVDLPDLSKVFQTRISSYIAAEYLALTIGVAVQHKATTTSICAHTFVTRGVHAGEAIANGVVAETIGGAGKSRIVEQADLTQQFWKLHTGHHVHSVICSDWAAVSEGIRHA